VEPTSYAREAFGDFAGFINGWSYWVTAWAGNAAIVAALTGYVEVFINEDRNIWWSIVIATAGLWIPVLINFVGLFFIKAANFGAFNSSGTTAWSAIAGTGAIVLFAYRGIETASVAAGRVRNPEKNVRRATVRTKRERGAARDCIPRVPGVQSIAAEIRIEGSSNAILDIGLASEIRAVLLDDGSRKSRAGNGNI
jgi:amino acid transporter